MQPQEQSRFGAVAAFGGTLAGLTALGFAPVGKKRVWDYYLKAVRAVEEISPARIFRTFQYSELLSPLGSNKKFEFPAEVKLNRNYTLHTIARVHPAVSGFSVEQILKIY